MSDVYKNASAILTNTAQTVLYTVPTANVAIVPLQNPVQAIVKSIFVCNTTSSALTITLVNTNASLSADVYITSVKSIAANTEVEILSAPLILEDSDILKGTSSGAGMHITVSILEISN
tara:strand:+ start:2074 stop:2430 length:357 start_codon:yes stop_codon:yes gene_type:complete